MPWCLTAPSHCLSQCWLRSVSLHGITRPQSLQWCYNGRNGISNPQPHHCLLSPLFRRRSKKTSKLCVNGLCAGNSPVTGKFPTQMASNVENVSISWCHHGVYVQEWVCVVETTFVYEQLCCCGIFFSLGHGYSCWYEHLYEFQIHVFHP